MSFSDDIAKIDGSAYFDSDWYSKKYLDVLKSGMTSAEHYLRIGGRLNRDPSPQFSTSAYLRKYPDVAAKGYNALLHYENSGKREKRTVYHSDETIDAITATEALKKINELANFTPDNTQVNKEFNNLIYERNLQSEEKIRYLGEKQEVLSSGFWDETWYLKNYAQPYQKWKASQNGFREPLDHYLQVGFRENYSPSEIFALSGFQVVSETNPISKFLSAKRPAYQFAKNPWIPTERRISEYLRIKSQRQSKKVVYCCIINNYDALIQHYYIDDNWDYICFTDDVNLAALGNLGIWEIRLALKSNLPADRRNRYHKINPHKILENYEESIYIDGNINILSEFLFNEIEGRRVPILLPEHFCRNCVYDELKALESSTRTSAQNKELLPAQLEFLQEVGFPREYGLAENNVIYRKHHDESVRSIMERWWTILCNFTSRDQLGFTYSLWKEGVAPRDVTFPCTRYLYSDFWMSEHRHESHKPKLVRATSKIYPAFTTESVPIVLSCNEGFIGYLGVVLTSIVENSDNGRNYDIIVLERDISDASKRRIEKLSRANISIRFYNMNEIFNQLTDLDIYVEGYVPADTYNKIFLSEIMEAFPKVLYIDTDVVVRSDIAELYDINLFGKAIGASRNVANIHAARQNTEIRGQKFGDYLEGTLGVTKFENYFQAGIVVLDMRNDKVKNLVSLGLQKLKEIKKPIFFDQCVFNSVFYDDVYYFSTTWNHVWYLQNYSYLRYTLDDHTFFDYAKSRLNPKIVHYASKDKPTNKFDWRLTSYFWTYASRSPYAQELIEKCDLPSEKASALAELLKEPKRKILVHLHVFFLDQVPYMIEKLRNISGAEWDLVVTSSHRIEDLRSAFDDLTSNVDFMSVKNDGYDVMPFLKVIESKNLSQYDYILKLHTKNSRPESETSLVYGRPVPGYTWRNELIDALLATSSQFESNLAKLEANTNIGMLASSDYIFSTEENREQKTYNLRHWMNKYGMERGTHYVGGTMFLARAYPFERLKRIPLQQLDFAVGDKSSGSHKNLAHVFERLLGLIVENELLTVSGT